MTELIKEAELLDKLNTAVKAANAVETKVAAAQAVLVSHSREVGLLLLEAKKLHPALKDFEEFVKKVHGLKLSRAYDLLRLAGGRTTDEELRADTAERVKRHRAKKKLPKPEPSVTDQAVTETTMPKDNKNNSADALMQFEVACKTYLPQMAKADLVTANCAFMRMMDALTARAA
jgi:hypothetical protein